MGPAGNALPRATSAISVSLDPLFFCKGEGGAPRVTRLQPRASHLEPADSRAGERPLGHRPLCCPERSHPCKGQRVWLSQFDQAEFSSVICMVLTFLLEVHPVVPGDGDSQDELSAVQPCLPGAQTLLVAGKPTLLAALCPPHQRSPVPAPRRPLTSARTNLLYPSSAPLSLSPAQVSTVPQPTTSPCPPSRQSPFLCVFSLSRLLGLSHPDLHVLVVLPLRKKVAQDKQELPSKVPPVQRPACLLGHSRAPSSHVWATRCVLLPCPSPGACSHSPGAPVPLPLKASLLTCKWWSVPALCMKLPFLGLGDATCPRPPGDSAPEAQAPRSTLCPRWFRLCCWSPWLSGQLWPPPGL